MAKSGINRLQLVVGPFCNFLILCVCLLYLSFCFILSSCLIKVPFTNQKDTNKGKKKALIDPHPSLQALDSSCKFGTHPTSSKGQNLDRFKALESVPNMISWLSFLAQWQVMGCRKAMSRPDHSNPLACHDYCDASGWDAQTMLRDRRTFPANGYLTHAHLRVYVSFH